MLVFDGKKMNFHFFIFPYFWVLPKRTTLNYTLCIAVTYFNWGPIEPNGGTGENCIQMWPGQWVDITCTWVGAYVCEIRTFLKCI